MTSRARRGEAEARDNEISSDGSLSPPHEKRQKADGTPITLDMLTQLLDRQTRELRESQRLELGRATAQLKAETKNLISGVEQKLQQHDDALAQLRQDHLLLQQRLTKVEATGSIAAASTADGSLDDGRKPALVFGGWGPSVKKPEILSDLAGALKGLQLTGAIDGEPYAPGIRKGIAIAPIVQRDAESSSDMRDRMLRIVNAVSEDPPKTPNMPPDKHLWSAISRPRRERERAQHAGKDRRLLHGIGGGLIARAEAEYITGSVWLGEALIASAVKPRPSRTDSVVAEGLIPGSWIDIREIARVSKWTTQQVHQAWQDAIAPS